MSSVGFIPAAREPVNELEELRKAHKELASLIANLEVADGALKIFNLGITAEYIKLAKWHAQQVQKSIEKVGQTKPGAKRIHSEKKFRETRHKRDNSR